MINNIPALDKEDLEMFVGGYISAILFAESAILLGGEDGEEIVEDDLSGYSLSPEAMDIVKKDCADFLENNMKNLYCALYEAPGYNYGSAGHDFWLTRQGHGAGFWDRGLGSWGDVLSKSARSFGERHVFIDENNELGIE